MSPSRRLLSSASTELRIDAARSWLGSFDLRATGGGAVDVLAPTRGAAHDFLRGFTGVPGLFDVRRLTPRLLAAELASPLVARVRKVPVSGLGLEALAARAVALVAPRFTYLAPVADLPGLPRALARTLEELRFHGVTPEQLRALESPRGTDLAALLATFLELLEESQMADPPAVFELARRALQQGPRAPRKAPLLLLDLSPASPLETEFLAELAAGRDHVLAVAVERDEEGLGRLEKALGVGVEPVPEPSATRALDRLRRRIFSPPEAGDSAGEAEPEDRPSESPESLIFFSAPGEHRECAEIGRRLYALAREGIPFDACAVGLRDPETYLPLLEEAFYRAEIPLHTSRGTRRPDPTGRALLALLACAAERLSATRFAEYLSLGQLPDADADGAPPYVDQVPWVTPKGDQLVLMSLVAEEEQARKTSSLEDIPSPAQDRDGSEPVIEGSLRAPRRWERLLVDAAVIEGRGRWRRRLDGVRNELQLQLRRLDQNEEVERHRLETELRQLGALSRFALPLIDDLAELPETARWGRWLDVIEKLASRAVKQPERLLETLAELRPMAEVGPVGLDEVRRVLEERLSTLRREPRGRAEGRVLVATLDELRGRSFHTVFLPGLAEGRFPRRASEDPLLPDAPRRRLAVDGGAALPTLELRVARERRLLHIAVATAERQLVASYPSLDPMHGRARVPSFYALDLLRAAEGRFPDLERLERRATAAASSRLGWPAPREARQAVDDAEYDLATLLGLMEEPDSAAGRARYLLEMNPRLKRSLRNRYARWARRFSAADGLVSEDPAALAFLATQGLTERSYSPTALQTFAQCPYRFLLYAVQRLRPRDRIERLERLDPLTRGALFHEVVFELLGQLREANLLPMTAERTDQLCRLADGALDGVARRYAEDLAPAIQRVWHTEIESLRLDLRGWVRAVIAEGDGWRPARFELAFGLPKSDDHDPASTEHEAELEGGRRLRGSIDLVEIHPDGRVRVTDHKTGRPPRRRHLQVGGGESLQPLLYALAAEGLLEGQVISGRLFFCTRRGGYRVVEVPLDADGRDAVDVVLGAAQDALAGGFLPAAPREGACRFCDFKMVCGPNEERRVARKRPDPRLGDVLKVRSLP